jgi:hypothetical protein
MGSRKGLKTEMMRDLAALTPKLPPQVGRKVPVPVTKEIILEMIGRFEQGQTLTEIERDPRFPSRRALHMAVTNDEALAARWEHAKQLHAEFLMEQTGPIADREVVGPDGRHDSGAVQRDKLRIEQRHMRAAALDPQRWGKQSTQTLVGDPDRPITMKTTLAPVEVMLGIRALLVANERAMGLLSDESRSDRERLAAITGSGKPVSPALYEILNGDDDQ